VATSPAAVHVVLSGQATFFGMALLYGGLRLLERSPIAAGVLFGLLSYKPQFCLLIPIALIAARQWRALFAAAATFLALGLASLAVLGPQVWIDFIEFTRATGGPRVMRFLVEQYATYMVTPFFSALVVGLPKPVASGLQLVTAAFAIVAVWHAFRRYPPSPTRTAVLIAGTFLVSPYMLNYDMLLLMPAVVMLYRRGVRSGFLPLEPLIYAGLWVTPTLCMGFSRHGLPYAPLAILAFGVMAVWRLNREGQHESYR
jgi:alpha-1,2-mannosyltransferase